MSFDLSISSLQLIKAFLHMCKMRLFSLIVVTEELQNADFNNVLV